MRADRRAGGIFYTPADIAQGLVAITIRGRGWRPPRQPTVCDPTCGAGAFLVAAADRLEALGHPPDRVVEDLIWGADVDADAIDVARLVLREWAAARGVVAEAGHLVVADTLVAGSGAWPDAPPAGFDVVVGNPPFQSQLATGTARSTTRTAIVRRQLGPLAAVYADSAALFLVVASRLAAPGGRVAMIVPESVLASRDAGPARAELLATTTVVGLWWAGEPVFDAGVQVCAPVFAVGERRDRPVRRWRGRRFATAATAPHPERETDAGGGPWSPMLATLRGTPVVNFTRPSRGARRSQAAQADLATLASATAGFRDQYYGLVPHVVEQAAAGSPIRLITAGLIDPLHCRWASAPTRFARQAWQAPVVDLAGLRLADPRLAGWADARLVPKVIVATQTRLLETVVDVDGSWWPSVPTISVVPRSGDPDELWRIAAVLSAPPVSAWALERFGGSALSSDALKLSSGQVLLVPLPHDDGAWADGAGAAAAAQHASAAGDADGWREALVVGSDAMTRAYGASNDVRQWWLARLPIWR